MHAPRLLVTLVEVGIAMGVDAPAAAASATEDADSTRPAGTSFDGQDDDGMEPDNDSSHCLPPGDTSRWRRSAVRDERNHYETMGDGTTGNESTTDEGMFTEAMGNDTMGDGDSTAETMGDGTETTDDEGANTPGQPGFGVFVALVALVMAVVFATRSISRP